MTTTVFWFSRLKPGVKPEDYERFLTQVDYPAAKRVPSIVRYRSLKVMGNAIGQGDRPFDFIDIAEITDIEAYRSDLETHPAVEEIHRQSIGFVETVGNYWTVEVQDLAKG